MTNDEKLKNALRLAMEEDLKAFVPEPDLEDIPEYKPPKSKKLGKLISGISITGLSSAALLLIGVGIYMTISGVFSPKMMTDNQALQANRTSAKRPRKEGENYEYNTGSPKYDTEMYPEEEAIEALSGESASDVLTYRELSLTQEVRDILVSEDSTPLLSFCPVAESDDRSVRLYRFNEFGFLCELDSSLTEDANLIAPDSGYYVLVNESEVETRFSFTDSTSVFTCSPNNYICFTVSKEIKTIRLSANDLEQVFSL